MSIPYHHPIEKGPRKTSRGLVFKDGKVLLVERWRDGLHYFSVPGGGIDPGETREETVLREITEETSIVATLDRLVYEMTDPDGHHHSIYLCTWVSGEPSMPATAPENADKSRYEPKWIEAVEVKNLPFEYWAPIGRQLVIDIENGFGEDVKMLAAD